MEIVGSFRKLYAIRASGPSAEEHQPKLQDPRAVSFLVNITYKGRTVLSR